jgi:hypothetical protein
LTYDNLICKDIFTKAGIVQAALKINVHPISLNELTPGIIAQSAFLEVNPYFYLYSDCYIRWYLLYHGAYPIDQGWLGNTSTGATLHEFQLSPQHSIEVQHQKLTNSSSSGTNEHQIFTKDLAISKDQMINLCSNGFKKYVFGLAQANEANHS